MGHPSTWDPPGSWRLKGGAGARKVMPPYGASRGDATIPSLFRHLSLLLPPSRPPRRPDRVAPTPESRDAQRPHLLVLRRNIQNVREGGFSSSSLTCSPLASCPRLRSLFPPRPLSQLLIQGPPSCHSPPQQNDGEKEERGSAGDGDTQTERNCLAAAAARRHRIPPNANLPTPPKSGSRRSLGCAVHATWCSRSRSPG